MGVIPLEEEEDEEEAEEEEEEEEEEESYLKLNTPFRNRVQNNSVVGFEML